MIKKITQAPTKVIITLAVSVTLTIFGVVNDVGVGQIVSIWIVALLFIIRTYYNGDIFKFLLSVFVALYLGSFFTLLVSTSSDYIIQPFFINILVFAAFVAQTYSSKRYQVHLRSRWLWVGVLTFLFNSIRLGAYIETQKYFASELLGVSFAIGYTLLWRLWASTTNVYVPDDVEVNEEDNFITLKTSMMLNTETLKWGVTSTGADKDGVSYLANMLSRASKEGKKLIVITPGSDDAFIKELKLKDFVDGEFIVIRSTNNEFIEDTINEIIT